MSKNISWGRGFLRLWIIYGAVVSIITALAIYHESIYISEEHFLYLKNEGRLEQIYKYGDVMDAILRKTKAGELTAVEVGKSVLYFFPDIPEDSRLEITKNYHRKYKNQTDERLLSERLENLYIGLIFLICPLAFGLALAWIFKGFRKTAGSA